MKMSKCEQVLNHFLSKHYRIDKGPLLLGLSGGFDSLALFHSLLQVQRIQKFTLHVAHIDHQWREESTGEALKLKKMVESYGVQCHILSVDSMELEGNLENACRDLRREFFLSLHSKYHYQALLLGHQANDQAETVLKRLFEGAGVLKLGGIQERATLCGLSIWRPWIGLKRDVLVNYLEALSLKAIDDASNRDCRYLRARMRENLIPNLSQKFGKDVTSSLCRLANESLDLLSYLDRRIEGLLESGRRSKDDLCFDLSKVPEAIEVKHFLRRLFEREDIPRHHAVLERIARALCEGEFDLQFHLGSQSLRVHAYCLILKGKFFLVKESVKLRECSSGSV